VAYDCAGIRQRVLAAWEASPARFREDANAEADAATGGYRDRLIVELAQNAVDAGGSKLRIWLEGDVLWAANDGRPLTDQGVVGLSTLRASAKRDGTTVGRYGVGFAAVLAVTENPSIGSNGQPSVSWSAVETRALLPSSLAAELAARGGHVPVLRLPFEGEPLRVPDGYDTVVRLPLTDVAVAERLLADVDPTLPLVLPGLSSLRVGDREISCRREGSLVWLDEVPWASQTRTGTAAPALMVGRPPEERPEWSVTAYAPIAGTLAVPQPLRAPTPTDELLSLPVVLAATVPLEPTRRRLVPGGLAEEILAEAGRAVAALLPLLDDPLPLVPVGLASGAVDAAVRTALLAALPETAVLQGFRIVDLGPASDAVTHLLAKDVDGLLSPVLLRHRPALDVLGVERLGTREVVELLAAATREPAGWHAVYDALEDAPDRDALGALPVPLVGGRVVTGCRGALLPDGPVPPEVASLPLRIVHPDAAHPLLERLGAVPATAAGLLEDPALRAAAEEADGYDDDLARGVCALVALAGAAPDWVAESLLFPGVDGPEVAGDLLLPGGLLDRAGADLPVLDAPDWLGAETACAAGVLDLPRLVDDEIADLDLVAELPVLLSDPRFVALLRRAPTSARWFGERGGLGAPADELTLPGDLDGLYDPAPDLDASLLTALGVRTVLHDVVVDPDDAGDLLDRLGDPLRTPANPRRCYEAVAEVWAGRADAPSPPLSVRTADGSCVPIARAQVVTTPDLLPLAEAPLVATTIGARDAVAQGFAYTHCTSITQDDVALPWRLHDGSLTATDDGLAAGLAWATGRWSLRHVLRAPEAERPRLRREAAFD
jgi:hypothetical protein